MEPIPNPRFRDLRWRSLRQINLNRETISGHELSSPAVSGFRATGRIRFLRLVAVRWRDGGEGGVSERDGAAPGGHLRRRGPLHPLLRTAM